MKALDASLLRQLAEPDLRQLLRAGLRGIERETLRVTPDGQIAQTPHPAALGAALTHPHITTDYSESLLELVTSPAVSVSDAWQQLHDIHAFVYSNLDDEMLWSTSMPCLLGGDEEIPIAEYGSSNVGRMKHVYRQGLAYRYGRTMQVISGVHFNYSVPVGLWPVLKQIEQDVRPLRDYIDARYFDLLRNFQRVGWLILYLFGSSPAVCKSFFAGRPQSLTQFDEHTVYGPYATSLRMSDIGYNNTSQANLDISYNNLADYVAGLEYAIHTPYPPYERVGVRALAEGAQTGEYNQLSTSILQIANEYYSFARPKQIALTGEKPTLALRRRGVAYIEVRALDVDPFSPTGVSKETMHFIECLLLSCLFAESPPADSEERRESQFNHSRAACCGRTPGIRLVDGGKERDLQEWAVEIIESLLPLAELLDTAGDGRYSASIKAGLAQAQNPDTLPSAHILNEMCESQESFFEFALRYSRLHQATFGGLTPDAALLERFAGMAHQSHRRQAEIEAADACSFEEYLEIYFAQA
ncbi:MAG: glutamate--cysteine ligase [Gammaproteobacteria bacterium]|nr:glutamate--cysteine ligase [Gammaproteobacteria bacterium]